MAIGTAAGDRGEHSAHHGKRPSRSNHYPAGALGFGSLEQHTRHHAISQQDQHQRAHEFPEHSLAHDSSTQSNDRVTAFFQNPYIRSRRGASIKGLQARSTAQRSRNSSRPLKNPTARPAA